MLKKKYRLKKKKDFDQVFKQGSTAREGNILIKLVANQRDISRFGFIVSKKVSNKATARNKVKRLLREATRKLLVDVKPGFDVVIVALSGIEKNNFWQIYESLLNLFKKTKLMSDKTK